MSLEQEAVGSDGELSPQSLMVPRTRAEFVAVMAHFHRAEIARMAGWRDRIDRTTNWAITAVAAMLSLSLSSPASHHGVLLFSMLVVLLLLVIEARRYRFFDVYRSRVRRMERNYYAQIFDPAEPIDVEWAKRLGQDLRAPLFLISLRAAMSRRFTPQLLLDFFYFVVAWVVKISSPTARDSPGGCQPQHPRADHCQRRLRPGAGLADHRDRHRLLCVAALRDFAQGSKSRRARHGEVHF